VRRAGARGPHGAAHARDVHGGDSSTSATSAAATSSIRFVTRRFANTKTGTATPAAAGAGTWSTRHGGDTSPAHSGADVRDLVDRRFNERDEVLAKLLARDERQRHREAALVLGEVVHPFGRRRVEPSVDLVVDVEEMPFDRSRLVRLEPLFGEHSIQPMLEPA